MPKRVMTGPLALPPLDPAAPVPRMRQLYAGLREAILSGRLAAGARLPSTRTLAAELGVARTTVVGAFEQLLAEGYVDGKVGSGTYVAHVLPDEAAFAPLAPPPAVAAPGRGLSQRGEILAAARATVPRETAEPRPFRPGVPALDAFPFALWARLAQRRLRRPPTELLAYGDPAGYHPLRAAIADYLGAARAVRCAPEQVIIVGGAQQALDLAARLLLDPGDAAWIEDPGYLGARGALAAAGARLIPVPVDEAGLDVAAGTARCPDARLAYVTPSHQFPLGVTMTLTRRLELLAWARRAGAWILEDDYDSEFRYDGRPLAALQGLDRVGHVLYVGTFSKVLFPALRLGYLVVPPALVDALVSARALLDRHSPTLDQAVLADFISAGHFVRHLRRMRELYAARQAALMSAASEELADLLVVGPDAAGMHVIGWLPAGIDDRRASRQALAHGVEVPPLSAYMLEANRRGGLLLGYAGVAPEELHAAVRRLASALRLA